MRGSDDRTDTDAATGLAERAAAGGGTPEAPTPAPSAARPAAGSIAPEASVPTTAAPTPAAAVARVTGPSVVRHALDAIHVLPPLGERWLAAAVAGALPEVTDPWLRQVVLAFLAEEAAHARAHERALATLDGYRVDLARGTGALLRVGRAGRRALRCAARPVPAALRRRLRHAELAAMVATEASTAAFGEWVLGATALDGRVRAPGALDLIRWHAAEEVAHRDVVPTLYAEVGGPAWLLAVVAVPVVAAFHLLWVATTAALGVVDADAPALHGPLAWRRARRLGLLPGPALVPVALRAAVRRKRPAVRPGAAGCRWGPRAGSRGA